MAGSSSCMAALGVMATFVLVFAIVSPAVVEAHSPAPAPAPAPVPTSDGKVSFACTC